MFRHTSRLQFESKPDQPDPEAILTWWRDERWNRP